MIRKLKTAFIIIISFNSITYGQNIITGTVVDQNDNPVSGLSVSLILEKSKVTTNNEGVFKLQSKKTLINDTISINGVSFKTIKTAVSELKFPTKFKIYPSNEELSEVVIRGNTKTKILHKFNRSASILYITSQLVVQEFHTNNEFRTLKQIILNRGVGYYSDNGKVKFKVHVYDVDLKTKMPGSLLWSKEFDLKEFGDGKVMIDTVLNLLTVPNDVFFIGIEKLILPYNERYTLHSDTYIVDGLQKKGLPSYNVYYEPVLYINRNYNARNWAYYWQTKEWKAFQGALGITILLSN